MIFDHNILVVNISSFILEVSIWCILLPLITGSLLYKKLDADSRLIFFLVAFATLPQILTAFFQHSSGLIFIYNIYTPVEFIFIYLFIGNKFQGAIFKKISVLLIFLFISYSCFLCMYYGLSERFLNEWVCSANMCYLIWIFLFILESLILEKKLVNTHNPAFWFITGLIIYTPCTIFVFALCYYIETSGNYLIKNLWIIHGIFNTILYVLFAIGLYQNVSKKNLHEAI